MPDITPEQVEKWTIAMWSLGSKGLLIFAVVYYRDLITKIVGTVVEVIASYLKRKDR